MGNWRGNSIYLKKLVVVALLAVVALSGCPGEIEVTPENVPKDQEGKSSTFKVTGLIKCDPDELIFWVKNTGESTIYWPYIFVGKNECKSIVSIDSAEDWRYDEGLYQRYLNKEYSIRCPDPEDEDALKHPFEDRMRYTVTIEAMRNTDTVVCDYSLVPLE